MKSPSDSLVPQSLDKISLSPKDALWGSEILKSKISSVRSLLDTVLSPETAITDDATSPRSFWLVSATSMATWRWFLSACNDQDTVESFLQVLRKEWELRPFLEFVLLKITLARAGKTFKTVSQSIVKKGNGWLLAERYLIWALNHMEWDRKKGPKFTAYAWPHELEPKFSKTAKQKWLWCDAFLSTWLWQGYPNVTFGIQFWVTLDADVEMEKITSLMAAHKSLEEKNTLLYKWWKKKYLDRFMPDGFILFHAENSLSAFTDPDRSVETIKRHEEWFNKWVKKWTPIDNLDPDTRLEIWAIQESFSGAFAARDTFLKNNTLARNKDDFKPLDTIIGNYRYIVSYDPRIKNKTWKPLRIEVRKKWANKDRKSVLYSLSVFL